MSSPAGTTLELDQKKLQETHKQQQERLNQYSEKHRQALKRVWDLQMRCYVNGNEECLHSYDQIFLEHHRLSREKLLNGKKCVDNCQKIRGNLKVETKFNSLEELDTMKKYYGCATPCVEKIIMDTAAQIKIVDKNIEVVTKYLDKK